MRALHNEDDLDGIADPGIRALVGQRFKELGAIEDYSLDELGTFWLIEPGDTVEAIEVATGCWINSSLFSDCRYGEPDYSPCHEVLEAHPSCWEAVWIFNDGGFGAILFIPSHQPGIDETLLAYCKEFATPAALPQEGNHAAVRP